MIYTQYLNVVFFCTTVGVLGQNTTILSNETTTTTVAANETTTTLTTLNVTTSNTSSTATPINNSTTVSGDNSTTVSAENATTAVATENATTTVATENATTTTSLVNATTSVTSISSSTSEQSSTTTSRPAPPKPTTGSSVCTANKRSKRCVFPFIYEDRIYHSCTYIDWHQLWCATDVDGDGEYFGPWGNCDRNCKEERPIKCYHKLAAEEGEPDLRYCRYTDDLCVYAFLKHEDGLHHSSQYCANSTEETWWRSDKEPCRYGNEGGYQCACRQSGCNFDEETSGYISMEDRFKMLLFFIFIIIMVILILIFCCKCCCRKKSSPKNNLHPHQPHHPPQPPNGPRRQKRMNMKQRVLLVVGFVCFAYIVSFFVEGGSNKSHKYRQNGI